ncbi:MAG: hypothetical protein KDA89_22785, partial [Planctomycetaceae bacterium]|nr:hypothetical protein [Planctomycetaceae bacterium]
MADTLQITDSAIKISEEQPDHADRRLRSPISESLSEIAELHSAVGIDESTEKKIRNWFERAVISVYRDSI